MNIRPQGMRGVSLIELMVALLIGSLLMLGLVQVFAASRTAYQLSEGMSRAQENGRFAMDYLQRDIRMAGHFGCVNDQSHLQTPGALTEHFDDATSATNGINFPLSVRGYDATSTAPGAEVDLAAPVAGWSPALPTAISSLGPAPGSDVIELRFLGSEGVPVDAISNPTATTTRITVPSARWEVLTRDGVPTPTMFGIADCSGVDVFSAPAEEINAAAGTIDVAAPIVRYTPQPAGQTMLYRAESIVYYIAPGASGQNALWRARSDNDGAYVGAEELVEGIENLQFVFGLDRTTDLSTAPPSGFIEFNQPASAMTDTALQWRRVGTVQVGLLASSPNPSGALQPTDEDNLPRALGVRYAAPANDTRFHTAYEATIALRNRLYGN